MTMTFGSVVSDYSEVPNKSVTFFILFWDFFLSTSGTLDAAAPYPVRPARPWPYLDFEK